MSEHVAVHFILMQNPDWGADWIYLLFVIGISILSWLGNMVKKRREGDASEEITDVDPDAMLEDVREPQQSRPPPVAGPVHLPVPSVSEPAPRPSAPPMAQPIGGPVTSDLPTRRQKSPTALEKDVTLAQPPPGIPRMPKVQTMPTADDVPSARPVEPPAKVAIRVTPQVAATIQDRQYLDSAATPERQGRRRAAISRMGLHLRDRTALRRAVVLAEILGRPIALRPHSPADGF